MTPVSASVRQANARACNQIRRNTMRAAVNVLQAINAWFVAISIRQKRVNSTLQLMKMIVRHYHLRLQRLGKDRSRAAVLYMSICACPTVAKTSRKIRLSNPQYAAKEKRERYNISMYAPAESRCLPARGPEPDRPPGAGCAVTHCQNLASSLRTKCFPTTCQVATCARPA